MLNQACREPHYVQNIHLFSALSVQVHLPRHNASIVTAAPHLKCAAVNVRLQVGIILLQLLNVSLAVLVQAL